MKLNKNDLLKYREYHWDYFSLHAIQRLKTFNFYIVVSTIFISAFINIIKGDEKSIIAGILPFLLSFTSYIFWKLDIRTKNMIKNAESAIKYIDDKLIPKDEEDNPNVLNIFRYDDFIINSPKKKKSILHIHLSYSKCFNLIFMSFGILGFLAGTLYLLDILIYK